MIGQIIFSLSLFPQVNKIGVLNSIEIRHFKGQPVKKWCPSGLRDKSNTQLTLRSGRK